MCSLQYELSFSVLSFTFRGLLNAYYGHIKAHCTLVLTSEIAFFSSIIITAFLCFICPVFPVFRLCKYVSLLFSQATSVCLTFSV